MRHILRNNSWIFGLVFSFILAIPAKAQIDCDITIDASIPVCPGGNYTLSVPYLESATYSWEENGLSIPGSDSSINVTITDETLYSVTVFDNETQLSCESELLVTIHPAFEIDFIQRQLTCTNGDEPTGNSAKVEAIAVGQLPPEDYTYEWNVSPIQIAPGNPSLAIGLKAHLFYEIKVTDNFGCSKTEKFWTESYRNPEVEIYPDPDTAYLQNPNIEFQYVNLDADSIDIINQYWYFGDESETSEMEAPTHSYEEEGTYNVELTVYNTQGCDTIYMVEVLIKPVNLFIPNVFTPNGDGINDTFIITEDGGSEDDGLKSTNQFEYESYDVLNLYYERSELHVFNRWGRIVYTSGDYQNDWDGGNLPDGVYFYVLKCFGAKSDDIFKGSISIYGSGR